MERTNIYLEKRQKEALKEHHEKTGICPAEAVRRAIDMYLKLQEKPCPEQSMKLSK